VIVDSREQAPFTFTGLHGDAKEKHRPLIVPLLRKALKSGDYSVDGYEDRVAIERKSLADLFSTLGQNRERFVAELERLNELDFAAVVIEAPVSMIVGQPPPHSQLRPKTVIRSIIAWQQRYRHVHWWPCTSRSQAEQVAFRILQRFYLDHFNPEPDKEVSVDAAILRAVGDVRKTPNQAIVQ
jgi:ERCC4-type nuclease